jgi:hypothetical protein
MTLHDNAFSADTWQVSFLDGTRERKSHTGGQRRPEERTTMMRRVWHNGLPTHLQHIYRYIYRYT